MIEEDPSLKSLEELKALRDKARQKMGIREGKEDSKITRVVVGMATCGIAAGARPVLSAFVDEVAREQLEHVVVTQTGCVGICQHEPVVEVFAPDGSKTTYIHMTPERAIKVVHQHLIKDQVVTQFTIGEVN